MAYGDPGAAVGGNNHGAHGTGGVGIGGSGIGPGSVGQMINGVAHNYGGTFTAGGGNRANATPIQQLLSQIVQQPVQQQTPAQPMSTPWSQAPMPQAKPNVGPRSSTSDLVSLGIDPALALALSQAPLGVNFGGVAPHGTSNQTARDDGVTMGSTHAKGFHASPSRDGGAMGKAIGDRIGAGPTGSTHAMGHQMARDMGANSPFAANFDSGFFSNKASNDRAPTGVPGSQHAPSGTGQTNAAPDNGTATTRGWGPPAAPAPSQGVFSGADDALDAVFGALAKANGWARGENARAGFQNTRSGGGRW